ncbi:hypothetical protein D7Y13_36345 [Corallococcus praedator]|uniref:Histidine kinase domain-containing protein n=1 Tax=Corallococcus praedator TaxID=2316724 RepID=A0ABX9Q691_9BACT|nr:MULTISPECIES: histidine kinase [Corallococcus]RKH08331.1 hypothetical protein D7X74_31795 [Corallococcus sp. CA047B]RKH25513.1 hypothetical protein D7X75_29940 [Corallococcus sp. CA031C]RKH92539.1 hypothetical protein D7Y13_36345 [Corallococcus praedator]
MSRRLIVGLVIVAAFILLKGAVRATSVETNNNGLILDVVFLAVDFAILTLAFEIVLRRGGTHKQALLIGTGVGVGLTVLFGCLAVGIIHPRAPHLNLTLGRQPDYLTVSLRYLLGFFRDLALWMLAFVYPILAADAERRRAEASELRRQSEIAQLRASLEPHFLLNTFNTIAGLVTKDPDEARRLLACLGELFDDISEHEDEWQTLDREVHWLKRYAEILEARHRGVLSFEWNIDEATRSFKLPRLLLQPLLENAVKHGALRRDGDGRVTVRSTRVHRTGEDFVVCSIDDNGPGLPPDEVRPGAKGLDIVRRRLKLHLPNSRLTVDSSAQGVHVLVEIPELRT